MNAPVDAAIRQQALDIHESFAVSAPAGSGKTGLLTQRVLALLGQCEQPENIVAITFTKKAAAEMQQRIMAALHHAKGQPEPPQDAFSRHTWELARQVLTRDQEQQWQLLALPGRLQITTIDSFCRTLSQQMPLSNNLGHTADMLDSAETQTAYQLAARETLALLEKNHPLQADLVRLIQHFNNQLSTVEALLVELLGRRDQWLGPLLSAKDQRQPLEASLQQVIDTHLRDCQQALAPLAGELASLADYAAQRLTAAHTPSAITDCLGLSHMPAAQASALPQWLGLAELILTQKGTVRSSITKAVGFPAADKTMDAEEKAHVKAQKQRMLALLAEIKASPELTQQLQAITTLPSPTYTEDQWQLLDSLTRILTILVAQLTLTFQQLGKTDFIEVTLAALHALGDEQQPTDLALALDYRIQHILVDEFQDTASPQLSLLQRLTAGWQPGDGRTLFVVGDAMQSCYGFRDANVGIFLDIRQHGIGDLHLIPLDLSVNFRSQTQLVDWCNRVFQSVFPAVDNINQGAVSYQPAVAFNPPTLSPAVEQTLFAYEGDLSHRQHEAEAIVDWVRAAQQQSPKDSLAILVRKRRQVSAITQALDAAEIDYRAVDIDRLDTSMVIADLLTLTRALLYPNDRIAWLALLRSPCCGLDMFDLYQVANHSLKQDSSDNNSSTPDSHNHSTADILSTILSTTHHYGKQGTTSLALSTDGRRRLQHFAEAIAEIFKVQGRGTLRQWLEGAWLRLGGNGLLLNDSEYQSVYQFFALLEGQQAGRGLRDWEGFVQAVSHLYRNDFIEDKQRQYPPVEIMTLHKSKGLEFDRVMIPGIDLASAPDKQQLLGWLEWLDSEQHSGPSRLVISPVQATGAAPDAIHRYIRQQKQRKQALEADRLFYVGCTRAIQQLHLLGYAKRRPVDGDQEGDKDNNHGHSEALSSADIDINKLPKQTPLAAIWPHINEHVTVVPVAFDKTTARGKPQHPGVLIRQQPPWQGPDYPRSSLLAAYRLTHYGEASNGSNHASTSPLIQRYARYLGTVLHGALQQLVESDYRRWDQQRIQNQKKLWCIQLQQLGTPPHLARRHSDKIATTLTGILKDKDYHWLLDHQHTESACELVLTTMVKGEIKERILDRTFIKYSGDNKTGTRWIIDYKSSEPETGETLENFAQREALNYQGQLAAYKALFDQQYPIKTGLFFPLVPYFQEVLI